MIESLVKNLNQDIALLQLKIEQNKASGLYDMARLLEAISLQFFKALDIADLKSKNQIHVNFPAIDSSDDNKRIALQVTSVADTKKVKKTIATFEKKDDTEKSLRDGYDVLYIFGFCRAANTASVPAYCRVVDPGFFMNQLIDLDDEGKVQIILDSVRRHLDYSSLHPYDDVSCLKIILGYVGRNAVRHHMSCEGSVKLMTDGLNEISELIGRGSVRGRPKSKAHDEFQDPEIGHFLRRILNEIGGITAIIHKAGGGHDFVCLSMQEMEAIDRRKVSITEAAQQIATAYDIDMPLYMHEENF